MSRIEHQLGLTPALQRLAFRYLKKGIGSHAVEPPYDAYYDEIIVRELYSWQNPVGVPAQGCLVVEFKSEGQRLRWLEFGVRMVGGGGDSILKEA